jgi:hypothetical protein
MRDYLVLLYCLLSGWIDIAGLKKLFYCLCLVEPAFEKRRLKHIKTYDNFVQKFFLTNENNAHLMHVMYKFFFHISFQY